MSGYQYTTDLIDDLLFRAGEPTDGSSELESAALRYLNRAYQAIWIGGGELDPTLQVEWWWLKQDPPGVINLTPPLDQTGAGMPASIAATVGSATVTFSANIPVISVAGFHLRLGEQAGWWRIVTHTAASAVALLDAPYSGATTAASPYRLYQTEYTLAADVLHLMSPMRATRPTNGWPTYVIDGVALPALEAAWPPASVENGVPEQFALVTETKVRFSHAGLPVEPIRVEYDYVRIPAVLTGDVEEEPLLPERYRHVLADAGLFFLMLDKSDARAEGIGQMARSGLQAMVREHHRRTQLIERAYGAIYPREPTGTRRGPIRDHAGFLIMG